MWRIWIKINKWNWPIPSCINPPKFMYIFIWTQPGAILPFTIAHQQNDGSNKARSRLDWADIWSLFQCSVAIWVEWVKHGPHPSHHSLIVRGRSNRPKAKSIRENMDEAGGARLLHSRRASPIPKYQLRKLLFILVCWPNGGKWIFCKENNISDKSHQYICF